MEIDLSEILDAPTVYRDETDISDKNEITDFQNLEFEDIPEVEEQEEIEESTTLHEIEIYNPAENAEILVELLDVVNVQTLTPLARWKLARREGGKSKVRQRQLLFEKKMNDSELTDKEKREIELYQAYLKDKKELESVIPYTDEEKASLKKAAIPYLTASKIKIGGGAAFWTQLAMIQGSRIMQVLTA